MNESAIRRPVESAGRASRRDRTRNRQHGLSCNHGMVLDLSNAGARIRCRRAMPVGSRSEFVLIDYLRSGDLEAEVVWVKPSGAFHFDIGLRFGRMSRELSDRLNSIAINHRFRRAV